MEAAVALREWKDTKRRKVYRASSLIKYRSDLQWLRAHGATYKELQYWLRRYHYVRVHISSVEKNVKKWQQESVYPMNLKKQHNHQLHQQLMIVKKQAKEKGKQSSLYKHKSDLQWLRAHGATYKELQYWLRRYHYVRVHISSVEKNVKKWQQEKINDDCFRKEMLSHQLKAIKTATRRNKQTKASRLDKHREEVLSLYQNGSSLGEIQHWLRHQRLVIHRSNISRRIKKWLEQSTQI